MKNVSAKHHLKDISPYVCAARWYRVCRKADRSEDAPLCDRDRVVELQQCEIVVKCLGDIIRMDDEAKECILFALFLQSISL